MADTMTTVSFAFYTGLGSSEPLINQITRYFTGRFMHCEIVFVSPGKHEACGIWQSETVFLRQKRFGKSCWEWIDLPVTAKQRETMYYFCQEQARRNIPFNTPGFYRCITPFPKKSTGKSWFCSELLVSCCQSAGILMNEISSASTPSSLHMNLINTGGYISTAPDDLVASRLSKRKRRSLSKWFVNN